MSEFSQFSSDAVIVAEVTAAAGEAGLAFKFREGAEADWQNVLDQCAYVPTHYLPVSVDYQFLYHRSFGGAWFDISLILQADDVGIAIWPLTISHIDGKFSLTSQG